MCGINGFTFHDPERLRAMHAATRHRGPDDEGFFEVPEISLAHNRLSIIDLSPGGHQPMSSADQRYTIVFNGEIYNYQELRAELEARGRTFQSQSDTEVLIAAFAEWGEACLPKLNGIFAFAIWDRQEERLTLARDHIGVKPLYYYSDGSRLVFSSEIKAILTHPIQREIDQESLGLYFRLLYVPGPRTMFRGIQKLQPGHVLTYQHGSMQIRHWWKLVEAQHAVPLHLEEAKQGIYDLTKAAVKRQLVSDRPLGVFLSGGIDSSSVLGLMREIHGGNIKTFSVGYESDVQSEKYNADATLARQTAEFFGTEHHSLTMTAHDVIESMDKVIWHMDEPISNHVQPSTYLLAQYAKPTITVALGGDGGDELFGGYPRYWYLQQLQRFEAIAHVMRVPGIRQLLTRINHPTLQKCLMRPGAERLLAFVAQKEATVQSFLKINNDRQLTAVFDPFFSPTWNDGVNQAMAADVQTWLPDESLMRTDKLTMAHGLEERVPLLDPELVAYAFRIPSRFKCGTRNQGKRIFIDAMKPILPPHVLSQEKRAWMSPAAKWIRGPLLPFMREILHPDYAPTTQAYLDFKTIQRMLDDHVQSRVYHLSSLWSIMTFQMWFRTFMK